MHITPVTTPKIIKKTFPNLVWEFPNSNKTIYLTFDDGPTPEITEWTLDTLDQYNAKATFFCIGKNVEEHPEIFSKIITGGHAIGNHTHNHLKGWKTKTKDYVNNVEKAQEKINNQIKNRQPKIVNLFRPPYGQIKPKQIKKLSKLGYKIIMWNVLSMDYDTNIKKEKCLKNVIDNTTSGAIVVFHDSIKASHNMQYALPKVLDYFSKKDFDFKRIPE